MSVATRPPCSLSSLSVAIPPTSFCPCISRFPIPSRSAANDVLRPHARVLAADCSKSRVKGYRTVWVKFCEGLQACAHGTLAHLGGCAHNQRHTMSPYFRAQPDLRRRRICCLLCSARGVPCFFFEIFLRSFDQELFQKSFYSSEDFSVCLETT